MVLFLFFYVTLYFTTFRGDFMKRFLLIFILLLSVNIVTELNDVPVEKGEYKGYRKLVGHKYRDRFDVCFKVTSAGQQIATVLTFKGINLKEKATLEMPDEEKRVV